MKTNYLFPNSFKKSSGIFFLLSILGLILIRILNKDSETLKLEMNVFALICDGNILSKEYFGWTEENNILDELLMVLFILSGLIFAFSKEKVEDEMVAKIRVESLVWATYVNYAVLLFCVIFIYGFSFFNVMIYNMFTLLLFFIIRFHWMLYKNNKIYEDEE